MRTRYADVDALLDRLLPGLTEVLGSRLLGLYLFGSVVTGDYDADVSDVDILAVVETPLTSDEFTALERHYAAIASEMPEWRDRIEVLHVSREALRTFRERASPIAVVSPGEPLNVKPAGVEWLMNWWMVRELGQTLMGPTPSELIAPISDAEYVGVIRGYARDRLGRMHESDLRRRHAYIVLTMCRTMHTSEFGGAVSKQAAAAWAAETYPQWAPLIADALAARLAWRSAERATAETRAKTAAFVDFALRQLADES